MIRLDSTLELELRSTIWEKNDESAAKVNSISTNLMSIVQIVDFQILVHLKSVQVKRFFRSALM